MERSVPGFVLNEEDRQIVQIVRELRRQLNIWEISANTVSWMDRFLLRKPPPEYARFWLGDVRLPVVLRGKLSSEEWKPLLASALLYQTMLGKRVVRMLTTTVFLPIFVAGPGFVAVSQALGVRVDPFQGLRLMLLVFAVGMLPFMRAITRLRLRADVQAAQLVGRDALRRSLEKVESVVGQQMSILALLRLKPTLVERIRNLD